MNVISMKPKTYRAQLFEMAGSGVNIKIAGTLDGFLDFALVGDKTYILTCEEAKRLADLLIAAIADVKTNCLYDNDVLLERGGRDGEYLGGAND